MDESIAADTDADGRIVGWPFAFPDKARHVIPQNATQLQPGANDDIYNESSGSWSISISIKQQGIYDHV